MAKSRPLIIIAVVLVLMGVVFLPGYRRLQRLKEEKREQQIRIDVLQRANEQLKVELERIKEDPDHLERKARDKLGIVREGEVIYSPR